MAKAKRKGKGRQKSKAAQESERQRQERSGSSEGSASSGMVEYKGGGGMMTRMRGGFQSAVGQNEENKPKGGLLSNVIWVLVVAALVFLAMGEMR